MKRIMYFISMTAFAFDIAFPYLKISPLRRSFIAPKIVMVARRLNRSLTKIHYFADSDELDVLFASGVTPVHLVMYHSILKEYSRKGQIEACDSIFTKLMNSDVVPNAETFKYLLDARLNSVSTTIDPNIELIFQKMLDQDLQPSRDVIVKVMKYMGRFNVADRVDSMFNKLSYLDLSCDLTVYNALLEAWCNSDESDAAIKAEETFQRLCFSGHTPNRESFELLLKSWSKSCRTDAAKQTYEVLLRMQSSGFSPTLSSFELVLDSLSRTLQSPSVIFSASDKQKSFRSLSTVKRQSNCVDHGMDQSSPSTSPARLSSEILQFMKTLQITPSQRCFESCAIIWSKNEKPEFVVDALSSLSCEMARLRLNLSSVLQLQVLALAASKRVGSTAAAISVLHTLESDSQVWIREQVYMAVVAALSRGGQPRQAENLLYRTMISPSRQSCDDDTSGRGKTKKPRVPRKRTSIDDGGKLAVVVSKRRKFSQSPLEFYFNCELPTQWSRLDAYPWNCVISAYAAATAHTSSEGSAAGHKQTISRAPVLSDKIEMLSAHTKIDEIDRYSGEISSGFGNDDGSDDSNSDNEDDISNLYRKIAELTEESERIIATAESPLRTPGRQQNAHNSDSSSSSNNGSGGGSDSLSAASRVYEMMRRHNVTMDTWTYASMISMWSARGQPDKEDYMLTEMIGAGLTPNPLVLSLLVKGWVQYFKDGSATSSQKQLATQRIHALFMQLCDAVNPVTGTTLTSPTNENVESTKKGKSRAKKESKSKSDRPPSRSQSIPTILGPDVPVFGLGLMAVRDDLFYVEESFEAIVKSETPLTVQLCRAYLGLLSATSSQPRSTLTRDNPAAVAVVEEAKVSMRDGGEGSESEEGRSSFSRRVFKGGRAHQPLHSSTANEAQRNNIDRALRVFQTMAVANIAPDATCYEHLLLVFERCVHKPPLIANRALELVKNMHTVGVEPTRQVYTSLLSLWVDSQRSDAPRMAEAIFRMMLVKGTTAESMEPVSRDIFLRLLSCWANSVLPQAAKKAEEILETMELAGHEPDEQAYSLLAVAWAKMRRFSARQQETVSRARVDDAGASMGNSDGGGETTGVEGGRIESLDNDAANTGHVTDGNEIELFVRKTEEAYLRCVARGSVPTAQMLSSLLSVWTHDKSPRSMRNVEDLLVLMAVGEISTASLTALLLHSDHDDNLAHTGAGAGGADAGSAGARSSLTKTLFFSIENHAGLLAGARGSVGSVRRDHFAAPVPLALPSLSLYGDIVEAWGAHPLQRAKCLLERIKIVYANMMPNKEIDYLAKGDNQIKTNFKLTTTYNLLLACYSQENAEVNLPMAELLYSKMIKATDSAAASHFRPTTSSAPSTVTSTVTSSLNTEVLEWEEAAPATVASVNLFLSCIYNSRQRDYASKCEGVLDSLPPTIQPDDDTFKIMYNLWVNTLAASGKRIRGNEDEQERLINAEKVQNLFERLMQGRKMVPSNGGDDIRHESTALPRLSTFTGLIHAWARVDPRRAADILNHIVSLGMKPPPNVYAKIISAWAEAGHAAKGEALFTSMLSAGNRPDPSCCRAVLRGLCAFHAEPVERESRGMRATQIVNIILQSGGALDEPMLLSVLYAWSLSRSTRAPHMAEDALHKGIASGVIPSATLFNKLLDIYAKSDLLDAPERAEAILDSMQQFGVAPNIMSYNTVISAWGRSDRNFTEQRAFTVFDKIVATGDLLPDTITFTSLLSALSRSRDSGAPHRADAVFENMLRSGIQPDVRAWTIYLTIWSRCTLKLKESVVHKIYERMIASGTQPNTVTYTALLMMWGNSRHPQASLRVVEIFRNMQSSGQKLDAVGYSSLLSALSRSRDPNAPLRADEVFERMLLAGIQPDTVTWTILITIWAKSKQRGKETKVQQIYDRMLSAGAQPSSVTVTSLLTLWGSSRYPQAGRCINEVYTRIYDDHIPLDERAFEVLIVALRRAAHSSHGTAAPATVRTSSPTLDGNDYYGGGLDRASKDDFAYGADGAEMESPSIQQSPQHRMISIPLTINTAPVGEEYRKANMLEQQQQQQQQQQQDSTIVKTTRHSETKYANMRNTQQHNLAATDPALDKAEALLHRMVSFGFIPSWRCWEIVIKADYSPQGFTRARRLHEAYTQATGMSPLASLLPYAPSQWFYHPAQQQATQSGGGQHFNTRATQRSHAQLASIVPTSPGSSTIVECLLSAAARCGLRNQADFKCMESLFDELDAPSTPSAVETTSYVVSRSYEVSLLSYNLWLQGLALGAADLGVAAVTMIRRVYGRMRSQGISPNKLTLDAIRRAHESIQQAESL